MSYLERYDATAKEEIIIYRYKNIYYQLGIVATTVNPQMVLLRNNFFPGSFFKSSNATETFDMGKLREITCM